MRTVYSSFVKLVRQGLAMVCVAGCSLGPGAPPPDDAFTDQAVAFLDSLQWMSFEMNRELCGYFGLDEEGFFVATDPVVGEVDYCDLPWRPDDVTVVASYHTHGAYTPEDDTEVPSVDDVRSDKREKVYGYISTPGGRVWLVDWTTGVSELLCGNACVTRDPAYPVPDPERIASEYSLRALRDR
jgi:hypothetical protein